SAGYSLIMRQGRTLAVRPKSTRQISPGVGRAILGFHHVEHCETFVGALIAVSKEIRFSFQIEDRSSQPAAFDERKFWKLRNNFRAPVSTRIATRNRLFPHHVQIFQDEVAGTI